MNENITRDQLAMAATEKDLEGFMVEFHGGMPPVPRKRSVPEARYAFADAMIKARGIPKPQEQIRPAHGWVVIRNGREVASDVLESFEVAINIAKRRSGESSRDVYSVASVGSSR